MPSTADYAEIWADPSLTEQQKMVKARELRLGSVDTAQTATEGTPAAAIEAERTQAKQVADPTAAWVAAMEQAERTGGPLPNMGLPPGGTRPGETVFKSLGLSQVGAPPPAGLPAAEEPPTDPRVEFAADPRAAGAAPGGPPRNPMAPGIGRIGAQRRAFEGEVRGAAEQQQAGMERQKDAAALAGEARMDAATAQADSARQLYERGLELRDDMQRNENRRRLSLMNAEKQLADISNDIRTRKIDPNRLHGRQIRMQIGNMIGNAFGVMAAAKLGVAGNTFAQSAARNVAQMQDAIDRDIASQREEIETLRTQHGMKQNGLQLMRARFGDERAADEAFRVASLENIKTQLAEKLATANIPGIQAETEQYLGAIDEKIGESRARLAGVVNENALRSITAQEQLRAAGAAAQAKAAGDNPQIVGLRVIGPVPEGGQKEAAKIKANYNVANQAVSDLRKFRTKEGYAFHGEEAVAVGKVKAARAINALKKLDEAGASFTDQERELITAGVPEDPTALGRVASRLEEMAVRLSEETSARLEPYGYALDTTARERVQEAR